MNPELARAEIVGKRVRVWDASGSEIGRMRLRKPEDIVPTLSAVPEHRRLIKGWIETYPGSVIVAKACPVAHLAHSAGLTWNQVQTAIPDQSLIDAVALSYGVGGLLIYQSVLYADSRSWPALEKALAWSLSCDDHSVLAAEAWEW